MYGVAAQIRKGKAFFTDVKILDIVRRNGFFSVTWHYRYDYLRARCNRLCSQKKLFMKSNNRGATVYFAYRPKTPPSCQPNTTAPSAR